MGFSSLEDLEPPAALSEKEALVQPLEARQTVNPSGRLRPWSRVAAIIYWSLPLALFTLSRYFYYQAGVRFYARTVVFFAQLLDPPLLRERLLESLWYLHAQPPVYNLLTGLVLKISARNYGPIFWGIFMLLGLGAYYLTLLTLRRLRLAALPALVLATVIYLSPEFVLYENWYFYPYLVNFLLVAAACSILHSEGRPGVWLALAFAAITLLALTRSVFHPAYLLGLCVLFGFLAFRRSPRRFLAIIILPLMLVLGWSLKNYALFGFFGTSSWGGNSLNKNAVMFARELLPEMVKNKQLHPLSTMWQFSRGDIYMKALGEGGKTGIPALDQVSKTTPSPNAVNYNHWIYPIASRIYLKDAKTLIRRDPARYWKTVQSSWAIFLRPTTQDRFIGFNRRWVPRISTVFEKLESGPIFWSLVSFALASALASALIGRIPPGERLLILFSLVTCVWDSLLSILLENGENNRMRFEIMGLLLIVVVKGLRDAAGALPGFKPKRNQ